MSETISETTGKITWFELPAKDTKRAKKFYGQLFGWSFEAFGADDYHLTYEAGGAINGALGQTAALVYFGTNDIDASIARVRELGGEAGDREEIPGFGFYSYCTDTEGTRFGLYQQTGG